MKFKLVVTKGIDDLVERKVISDYELMSHLIKFINNDWGVLSDEDKELQDELLKNPNSKYNERFMGGYMINENKIWYFREYDYSIDSLLITILLPEEY